MLLKSVILSSDCTPDLLIIEGQRCHCVDAHLVIHLLCALDGNESKVFHVSPKTLSACVKAPLPTHFGAPTDATISFKLSMIQLPVLVNNSTTGHKLHDQTKDNLVISVWSQKKNWNYVALSRVTKRQGLFLVQPLPTNIDFSISDDLLHMTNTLKTRIPQPIEL